LVRDDAAEFRGKGWGHGVGLCQWGSFGQSLVGSDYQKILQFYYPGSKIAAYRPDLKLHEAK
jgi:stage II sporulation protein D